MIYIRSLWFSRFLSRVLKTRCSDADVTIVALSSFSPTVNVETLSRPGSPNGRTGPHIYCKYVRSCNFDAKYFAILLFCSFAVSFCYFALLLFCFFAVCYFAILLLCLSDTFIFLLFLDVSIF